MIIQLEGSELLPRRLQTQIYQSMMSSQPNEEVQIEEQKYQSIHRDREGTGGRKVGID